MIKCISWNVNGIRACVQKGFEETFHALDADFFCIQESKMQEGQLTLDLLELCGKERILRHGDLCQKRTPFGKPGTGDRGT